MANSCLHLIEEKVLSEFVHLELDKLDGEWVKQVIGQEFVQCDNLPSDYDEILDGCHVVARLKTAQKHCQSWLESNEKIAQEHRRGSSTADQQSSEAGGPLAASETLLVTSEGGISSESNSNGAKFWAHLMQRESCSIESLVALVGCLIDKGSAPTSVPEAQERCFAAASLYLTLICVPGSMAFKAFHKMLYLKALELVQLYASMARSRQSQAATPKKGSKQQTQMFGEDEDGDEAAPKPVSEKEAAAMERHVSAYMKSVDLVSKYLSLKRYPNILRESIETMLPVMSLARGPVSVKALEIMQQFCNPLHGDASQTVHYIFVHLVPYLSLDPDEKNLADRQLLALKEVSLNLVRNFSDKFKGADHMYPLIRGLIQHLCLAVVDRAEHRQRTAQTVVGDLLNLVPADKQQGT